MVCSAPGHLSNRVLLSVLVFALGAARRHATLLHALARSVTIGVRAHPLLPGGAALTATSRLCPLGIDRERPRARPSRTLSCYCAKSPRPPARTVSARALRVASQPSSSVVARLPTAAAARARRAARGARRGVRPRAGRGDLGGDGPGHVRRRGRLRAFVTAGVNRVSLGVQSFDDDLPQAPARVVDPTSAADVHDAIARVQHSRVGRFSVDLMTGLPGLTKALWHATLETALATGTPHMAVYDLQVEDGTAFARRHEPGVAPLPTEDACASMLRDAAHALGAAGLQRYEVSNFARAGFECAHNACYWANKPHLAFGNGAARCRRSRQSPVALRARPSDVRCSPTCNLQFHRWASFLAASLNP